MIWSMFYSIFMVASFCYLWGIGVITRVWLVWLKQWHKFNKWSWLEDSRDNVIIWQKWVSISGKHYTCSIIGSHDHELPSPNFQPETLRTTNNKVSHMTLKLKYTFFGVILDWFRTLVQLSTILNFIVIFLFF